MGSHDAREWNAIMNGGLLDFGIWICDVEMLDGSLHRSLPDQTNQPIKTMGDKSPKANQKKKAQKNAKASNSSQAKKPDGPKK